MRWFMAIIGAVMISVGNADSPGYAWPCNGAGDDVREEKIDQIFAPWSVAGSPGAAVGVYREGEMVFQKGYGLAHLEHDVPITPETVFYLGSVSKQFVATAVLLLVDDGKLSLADSIRKYIPELPEYTGAITVEHLIHHTSGIRDYLGLMQLAGLPVDYFHEDDEIISLLARQRRVNFEPGSQYSYSNSGYLLLNVIVARVSGQSLREFAQERIFGPLHMTSTRFHDDYRDIIPHRAMGYFPGPRKTFRQFMNTFDRVGSGGVYSNVIDLFRWEMNFRNHHIGGQALYDAQHRRGRLNNNEPLDYAAGLVHSQYRGLRIIEHSGALGGYRAAFLRFPDQRLAISVLANLSNMNPGQLAKQVADVYLGELAEETQSSGQEPPPPTLIELAVEDLESFTGHYWNRSTGLQRQVKLDGTKLYYVRSRTNRSELGATGKNAMVMLGVGAHVPVVFENDRMTVTAPGEGTLVYEKYEPQQPSSEQLAEFAGSYYSAELDRSFRILVSGNVLVLDTGKSRFLLPPVVSDVFALPQARLVMTIDRKSDTNQVIGFHLNAGSLMGLVFERTTR